MRLKQLFKKPERIEAYLGASDEEEEPLSKYAGFGRDLIGAVMMVVAIAAYILLGSGLGLWAFLSRSH